MIVLYWSVEYFATLVETILCCILVKIFIKNESFNDKNSKMRIFVYSCLASIMVMTVNKMELFSLLMEYWELLCCFRYSVLYTGRDITY